MTASEVEIQRYVEDRFAFVSYRPRVIEDVMGKFGLSYSEAHAAVNKHLHDKGHRGY